MATLIAAFKARAVIADAKAMINEGNAVVIQMQNTYEAQLNRALARMEDINDIRLEPRSEEHTSELQSLMRISYAVFCLKKKKKQTQTTTQNILTNTIHE